MDYTTMLKVVVMTLLPVFLTVVLKILQVNWKPFKTCKNSTKNIVVGIIFGLCAIYGTEFGVNTGLAIVNTRDAAVICAGLFFGGPAAGIAAVIGSVERFLAPLWGFGAYTRWACSIATFCAGGFTALLRYYFFEKKKPQWHQALAVGIFIETFHLLLVFVTHMNDIHNAFIVIKACSGYMLLMNGISVMLSSIAVPIVERNSLKEVFVAKKNEIGTQFNLGILYAMVFGFVLSITFTAVLENRLCLSDTERILDLNIVDVEDAFHYSEGDVITPSNLASLAETTQFRHIYQNGYVVIADPFSRTVSANKEISGRLLGTLGVDVSLSEEEMHRGVVNSVESYYKFKTVDGYYLVACVPVDEAKMSSELSMYIVFFLEMIVFALMFINLFALIKILVLKNLENVNSGLKEITQGNLDTSLDVEPNIEFKALSDGINTTVGRLKQLISEANARIDAELEVAKQIQSSSLPTEFPVIENGKIFALMDTAKEVGGDFYDFFLVPPYNMFVLIADVSGKGIPAAMFMMKAKTLIRNLASQTGTTDIGHILTEANHTLCAENEAEMFVTCWMGCINLSTGHVTFANAGHNKPVIKKAGEMPHFLEEKVNLVLAGMDGIVYKTQEFDMNKGDTLYLYTDGITEATNKDNQLFGDDRLLEVVARASYEPEDLCKKVKEAADQFTGEAPQFDDMTELAFAYF